MYTLYEGGDVTMPCFTPWSAGYSLLSCPFIRIASVLPMYRSSMMSHILMFNPVWNSFVFKILWFTTSKAFFPSSGAAYSGVLCSRASALASVTTRVAIVTLS